MSIHAYTNIGTRNDNQDSFWVADLKFAGKDGRVISGSAVCVCDGMGGLSDGQLASSTVIKYLREVIVEKNSIKESDIIAAINKANTDLYNYAAGLSTNEKRVQVGTTCTLMILLDGKYKLFHAGDTRCYHIFRDSRYNVLTEDQTAFEKFKREGKIEIISKANGGQAIVNGKQMNFAKLAGLKSKLTRCVGAKDTVKIDVSDGAYTEGDIFLISSDGFWHGLDADKLSKWPILLRQQGETGTDKFLRTIVDSFISRGEKDNLTATVVRV